MSDDSDEVLAVSLISVRRVDFRQSVRDRKDYLGVSWRKLYATGVVVCLVILEIQSTFILCS